MGYAYRMSGRITLSPVPAWADLKRSGFIDWGDRDLRIDVVAEEADDGRRTVTRAVVEPSSNEPRCYDLEAELQSMIETFAGVDWAGFIEGIGEDGTDQFRLYVADGRAVLVRPTITWPEGAR